MTNLYMMCGVSGSGKTTWADAYAKVYHAQVFSSDAIRAELFGDENNQKHNSQVFDVLHERVRSALIQGKDCVYDATNLNRKRRIAFLNSLEDIENLEKTIIICAAPFSECVARDKGRARTVGKEVIYRQISQFEMPLYEEGWDTIVATTKNPIHFEASINLYNLEEYLKGQTSHDCAPHHLETIEFHMLSAYKIAEKSNSKMIQKAMRYHDIGKFSTRRWNEKKNRMTYYNHENWGAWMWLASKEFDEMASENEDQMNEAFMIAMLISEHMKPFHPNWEQEAKFYDVWTRTFIELVHYYDELACVKGD